MTALKLAVNPSVRELLESWKDLPVEKRADWCKSHLSDDQYRNAKAYGWEHRNLGACTPHTHKTFPKSFRKQSVAATMAIHQYQLPQELRGLLATAMHARNTEEIK